MCVRSLLHQKTALKTRTRRVTRREKGARSSLSLGAQPLLSFAQLRVYSRFRQRARSRGGAKKASELSERVEERKKEEEAGDAAIDRLKGTHACMCECGNVYKGGNFISAR